MATRYLQFFPKPVLDDLVTGRWLPIVGAGMSLNARVSSGKRPPLWGELGRQLERDLNDFAASSPIDAISAYEHEYGRARLIERLSDILLLREAQPGDAHKEFCSIPFDLVCTTNFDFLLERQYELIPRYVYPVVDEDQLSLNAASAGTLLLKLHGDMHHPGRLILTESDYDGFLAKYPLMATYLANQLITKSAVLIGYSLDDPDFRQIWHVVSQRLGRTRRFAYAIAVGAKQSDISRFERRGVNVINLPGSRERYGEVLAATFVELRDHLREKVLSVSTVIEERPLRELLLPRDASTRLCFFSLPLELLPFYRERVFPAVEEAGFVPVTADDVVSPGDNISAKIDALIDRSHVMVVELSSAWTLAELRMAIARLKNLPDEPPSKQFELIIVATNEQQIPPEAREFPVLLRQETWVAESEEFVSRLLERLRHFAPSTEALRIAEARRLLNAKEYRAAIIAAMTHMETTLRERLEKRVWEDTRRPPSMRLLIDRAIEQGIISPDDRPSIDKWTRLRNGAVHTSQPVSSREAREIVEGVLRVLGETQP